MVAFTSLKLYLLSFVLVVFHLVGLFGMSNDNTFAFFASLSWLNLLLTFVLFLISYEKIPSKLVLFFLLCFFTGMGFEWIGVHSGLVFGEYSYGTNLGWKLFGVPVTIGLNWVILTVSSANVAAYTTKNTNLRPFLGACLMVVLDFFIEQLAPNLDFWYWQSGDIPLYNYITWFFIGLGLQWIYFKFKVFRHNFFSLILFIVLMFFFVILNVIL